MRVSFKILILLSVLLSSVNLFAQHEKSGQLPIIKNEKKYTENIMINGAELDKRIAKYYTESDMQKFTANKVHQLNYLYLSTFNIINQEKLDSKTKKYIQENFDSGLYDHLRKQKERSIVQVEQGGYSFEIELFSREEIIKHKNTIKE